MLADLDRQTAARRLAEALADRAPGLRPDNIDLAGWTAYDCNGAVVICRGDEIHVAACAAARGRWFNRGDFRRLVVGMLREFGRVTTSVAAGNAQGERFVRALGFRQIGRTARGLEFMMEGSRYA